SDNVVIINPLRISSQLQSRIRYRALIKEQQIQMNTSCLLIPAFPYPFDALISITVLK
ncbi:8237_t:CDS:1, partial [Funneliformis geosporum]